MAQSFRDSPVWQRAVQLTVDAYELTRNFSGAEQNDLGSQIRNTAIEIPTKIAAGHRSFGDGEYGLFLRTAYGSNLELQTQLELAKRLGFGKSEHVQQVECSSLEVGKMLCEILEAIRQTRSKGNKIN
jgi:four helix bundle protein